MSRWYKPLRTLDEDFTSQQIGEAERAYLKTIANALREQLLAEAVILFGSTARGEATTESDIDLLIIAPTHGDFYRRMAAARKAVRTHRKGKAITPIVLTPDEFERLQQERNAFIEAVLREGVLIQ